jgi:transcriptional regulator with XRE-family HTH domain
MPRLFGEKLRHLRRQHGVTQEELARRLGLRSHTQITRLERSKNITSSDVVLSIATLFETTSDYLLDDAIAIEDVAAMVSMPSNPDTTAHFFGEKLRTLRLQQGLSQKDLMRRLGLASRAYISNLEANRKMPSLDLVAKVANFFGVTTDYLLRESIPIASRSVSEDLSERQ